MGVCSAKGSIESDETPIISKGEVMTWFDKDSNQFFKYVNKGVARRRSNMLIQESKRSKSAIFQFYCGVLFQRGFGCRRDYVLALDHFLLAAKQNHLTSIERVAQFYKNGIGTDIDEKEAFYWYQKAAELGSKNGLKRMASFYYEGKVVEKDEEKAKDYEKRSRTVVIKRSLSWRDLKTVTEPNGNDKSPNSLVEEQGQNYVITLESQKNQKLSQLSHDDDENLDPQEKNKKTEDDSKKDRWDEKDYFSDDDGWGDNEEEKAIKSKRSKKCEEEEGNDDPDDDIEYFEDEELDEFHKERARLEFVRRNSEHSRSFDDLSLPNKSHANRVMRRSTKKRTRSFVNLRQVRSTDFSELQNEKLDIAQQLKRETKKMKEQCRIERLTMIKTQQLLRQTKKQLQVLTVKFNEEYKEIWDTKFAPFEEKMKRVRSAKSPFSRMSRSLRGDVRSRTNSGPGHRVNRGRRSKDDRDIEENERHYQNGLNKRHNISSEKEEEKKEEDVISEEEEKSLRSTHRSGDLKRKKKKRRRRITIV